MNTIITYQYRDAANYKVFDSVIVCGLLSLGDIEEYLYDEEFFIPSEVALKNLQPENIISYDHVWHEILEIAHTTKIPTVDISAHEIVNKFKKACERGWNIYEVSKRLGIHI